MTDRLKIVRIRARNVPRKQTQAPRRRCISRISLSLQESDGVACWCARVLSCWNKKFNHLRTTCACLAVASEQESCRVLTPLGPDSGECIHYDIVSFSLFILQCFHNLFCTIIMVIFIVSVYAACC